MKPYLLLGYLLITIPAYSQWQDYKVDSSVSVLFPVDFQINDTLGPRVVVAPIEQAVVMVIYLANKKELAVDISSKKELLEYYKTFEQGAIEEAKGTLVSREPVEMNGLLLHKFSYTTKLNGDDYLCHILVLFLNETTYAFHFWELEGSAEEKKQERDQYFSSIKTPVIATLKDQFSNKGSASYKIGYKIGQFLVPLILVGVALVIVLYIARRKKRSGL